MFCFKRPFAGALAGIATASFVVSIETLASGARWLWSWIGFSLT